MNDSDFIKLKEDIELKSRELELLQEKYLRETGIRYVVPIYIKEK